MTRETGFVRFAVGFAVLWLFTGHSGFAQQAAAPPPQAKGNPLEDSVQALAGEVKELNATIQELRAEVARSRQETNELRGELHGVMEKLSATAVAGGTTGTPTPGAAQAFAATPAPPTPPVKNANEAETSTNSRLGRLEDDLQLLQSKVDEQHQTKVESQSQYRVKLGGIALINLFGNSGTVDNQDIPNLALPREATSTSGSVGGTLRQSEIGLQVYGPTLAGARASGDINFDFMGGFSNYPNGVTEDLVRLRTATLRLDWAHTSLVAGQDAPFFSPLSPTSLASLGYPAFAEAGNLWTWTPQVRVEHRLTLSEANVLLLQGGVLDPLSGEEPTSQDYRTPDAGEQSRKPAVGSRVAWAHGGGDHVLTLGIGGYYSRQNYGGGRTMDAWAGTADWDVPLGNRFTLSGEFYRGRALGGLGAAEGRSVIFDGAASDLALPITGLNTVGGWTQLKFKATEKIEFNAAFGQDNPFARDLHYYYDATSNAYAYIAKNQNTMFNVIYRPRSDLLFALEYRYLDTLEISDRLNTAGTLNLSMGILF